MIKAFIFLILGYSYPGQAGEVCAELMRSGVAGLKSWANQVERSVRISAECAEAELVDLALDPYRKQSIAMELCAQDTNCIQFLQNEAARVSRLPVDRFKNLNTVALWGEITKYSGINRLHPPQLEDLPLATDPVLAFERLKQVRVGEREISQHEQVRAACSLLAAIIGPAKFKSVTAISQFAKLNMVRRSHDVEKLISKNRIPNHVREKFQRWEAEVNQKGIEEVRKIPGYHDEPIKSLPGRRSVRMSDGFRACYESTVQNGLKTGSSPLRVGDTES